MPPTRNKPSLEPNVKRKAVVALQNSSPNPKAGSSVKKPTSAPLRTSGLPVTDQGNHPLSTVSSVCPQPPSSALPSSAAAAKKSSSRVKDLDTAKTSTPRKAQTVIELFSQVPTSGKAQASTSSSVTTTTTTLSEERPTTLESLTTGAQLSAYRQLRQQYQFYKSESIQSIHVCGTNVTTCAAYIEEQRFQRDMNQAQIESERYKKVEAERRSKVERETLNASSNALMLFPHSSFVVHQQVLPALSKLMSRGNWVVQSTHSSFRTTVLKYLELEKKAMKWYGRPAQCYAQKVSMALEQLVASHPSPCACWNVSSCEVGTFLLAECEQLSQHLYAMPENQGGVPLAFLKADEDAQYTVDDDGFEIL